MLLGGELVTLRDVVTPTLQLDQVLAAAALSPPLLFCFILELNSTCILGTELPLVLFCFAHSACGVFAVDASTYRGLNVSVSDVVGAMQV